MLINPSSVLQVTWHYEVQDEECTNVFWYGSDSGSLPMSAMQFAARFESTYMPLVQACSSAVGVSFNGIDVYPWQATSGPPFKRPLPAVIGGVAGHPVPANVALHLWCRQSDISQRVRRPLYISGTPEAWWLGSTLLEVPITLTPITNLATFLRSPITPGGPGSNAIPCIRHRVGPAGGPYSYEFYSVSSIRATSYAAHLRRRSIFRTRGYSGGSIAAMPDPLPFTPAEVIGPLTFPPLFPPAEGGGGGEEG